MRAARIVATAVAFAAAGYGMIVAAGFCWCWLLPAWKTRADNSTQADI